jgi:hypothetical protein
MKTEVELSETALAILADKARHYDKTVAEILEWMIADFGPSTEEEKRRWGRERDARRRQWLSGHPGWPLELAWNNGYRAGWESFQTRKSNHPFRPPYQPALEVA